MATAVRCERLVWGGWGMADDSLAVLLRSQPAVDRSGETAKHEFGSRHSGKVHGRTIRSAAANGHSADLPALQWPDLSSSS